MALVAYASNFFPFSYHCCFKTFRNKVYLLNNYLNYNIFSYITENKQFYLSTSNSFTIISKLVYILIMKYFTQLSLIFCLFPVLGVESDVTDKRLHIHMKAQMSSKDINRAIIFRYSNIISTFLIRLLFEI